jgi:hypothetical protein
MSLKKKEFIDLEDFLFSFRIYFLIVGDSSTSGKQGFSPGCATGTNQPGLEPNL